MSKKKQAPKIPVPRNLESFRENVLAIVRLQESELASAGAATAMQAEALQSIANQVADLQADSKRHAELKEAHLSAAAKYALANIQTVFGADRQTTQIGVAECGYKLSPQRVATDSDDVDPVDELGKHKWGKAYIRTKPSVDKTRLLSDYRSGVITDQQLAEVGLAVVQDTVFFVRLGGQVLETIT